MPRPINITEFSIYEGAENLTSMAQYRIRIAFRKFAAESDNSFEMFNSGEIGLNFGRMTVYCDAVYTQGKRKDFKAKFCYEVL
jgi:hypothetical protein